MKSIKILVGYGKVLGYSEDRKIINEFIKEQNLEDYKVFKIEKIPEDIEEEFAEKELVEDTYYGCIISDQLLRDCSIVINTMSINLLEFAESLEDCIGYLRLEPHEHDIVFEWYHHIRAICDDTIGINDYSPEGYYSDYYEMKDIITICIKETGNDNNPIKFI